jgi:hypothetical protein
MFGVKGPAQVCRGTRPLFGTGTGVERFLEPVGIRLNLASSSYQHFDH